MNKYVPPYRRSPISENINQIRNAVSFKKNINDVTLFHKCPESKQQIITKYFFDEHLIVTDL